MGYNIKSTRLIVYVILKCDTIQLINKDIDEIDYPLGRHPGSPPR